VQEPGYAQNYNRYTYCLNNPLIFTDPTGHKCKWSYLIPVFGTVQLFAQPGFNIAENQGYSKRDWQYWAYGYASNVITGISIAASAGVAGSGIAFANTASIMTGSFTHSLGMHMLTGGQTDVSVSFGLGTYNLSSGEFRSIFNWKDLSTIEKVGYGLGALANFQDFMGLGERIDVTLASEKDLTENWHSHSLIKGDNVQIDVYPGEQPDNIMGYILPRRGENYANYLDNSYLQVKLSVNKRVIQYLSGRLNSADILADAKGFLFSKLSYQIPFNSCSTFTARALWLSGIPNFGGIHPHFLHYQMVLRNAGFRPSLYLHYLTN